jgi:hypothetical protein
MIFKKNIPIWNRGTGPDMTYIISYNKIIDNFERSCYAKYSDNNVLFIDNTYINGPQVLKEIEKHDVEIVLVFSLVDPPYTWHHLKQLCTEKFPKIKFIFIGNDAPDFNIPFGLMWAYQAFPNYNIQNILPTNFNYVYLNYNGKKQEHRIKFTEMLVHNKIDKLGFYTLLSTEFKNLNLMDLGNLNIWNQHFLNIVSESAYRIAPELLISEKTWKPIVGLRPFIINGSPRYYFLLQEMGFDCFSDIFPVNELSKNESTVETTMKKSHQLICNVIKDLATKNLQELYTTLYPRLLKNREHFFNHGEQLFKTFCENKILL